MNRPVRSPLRRAAQVLVALVVAVLATAAGAWLVIQHDDNLHAVEPGLVFRSAQMSGDTLARVIAEHHVRTVLNLRGPNPGQPWYDDEVAAARAAGVRHIDIALSARQQLTPAQLAQVRDALATAPRPLLIHCNSGADRTGLVSALYQL